MITVNEFLLKENPEKYDFKLECGNEIYASINNPLERFMLYKSSTCLDSKYFPEMDMYIRKDKRLLGIKGIHCNTSILAIEIYRILWKELINESDGSKWKIWRNNDFISNFIKFIY